MSALICTVPPPVSSMPARFTVLKPVSENVTVYAPGRRSTILYWPVASVVTARTFSMSAGLAASTVTPGSTAPDVSLTTPASDGADCANAVEAPRTPSTTRTPRKPRISRTLKTNFMSTSCARMRIEQAVRCTASGNISTNCLAPTYAFDIAALGEDDESMRLDSSLQSRCSSARHSLFVSLAPAASREQERAARPQFALAGSPSASEQRPPQGGHYGRMY